MTRMPAPDEATESLLAELHRRDYEAVLREDRVTMTIARLLWGETFLAAYGLNPEALPHLSEAAIQLLPDGAERSPVWRELLRARPLVKVIRRVSYNVPFGHDRKAKWYREQLECGHELHLPADFFGNNPPDRRRCKSCGNERYKSGAKNG